MPDAPRPHHSSEPPSAAGATGDVGAPPPRVAPEHRESLWWLAAGPSVWAVHFLACYLTAAIHCAKVADRELPIPQVRTALVVYTVVALGAIAWIAVRGWRRHRVGTATVPHEADSPQDRHRFLGFATWLLAGLSAVAVVYASMVIFVFGSCR